MFEIGVFIVGVVFFFALFGLIDYIHSKVSEAPHQRRDVDRSDADDEKLPYATCSKDMYLRFKELDLEGANIRIVGGDASYFQEKNGDALAKLLRYFVSRGAHVEYLLLRPSQSAILTIEKMGLLGREEIDFRRILSDTNDAAGLSSLLDEYLHQHPTLVNLKDGGRAMWLEGHHPPRSVEAYGVVYVSPKAMSASHQATFEMHKRNVDKLYCVAEKILPKNSDIGEAA